MSCRKHVPALLFSFFLIAILTAPAQEGGLAGPVSGLVFDAKARAIRPILGVPGGAHLGAAAASGLEWAAIAPSGKAALGFADGRLFLLRRLANLSMSWTLLAEGVNVPATAAWSAASDAAAAYWTETGRLQVWKSLNSEPVTSDAIDLSGIQGRLSALALPRSGVGAVFGVAAESGGGIYAVSPGEAPSFVVPVANPTGIVLSRDERNLFVADLASGQVLEVTDFRGSAGVVPLRVPESGTAELAGIALSSEGRRLFVADKADRTLNVYDLESRALLSRTALEFVPELAERLSESGLFLLRRASETERFQVLDANLEPLIYFIPAVELPAEEATL